MRNRRSRKRRVRRMSEMGNEDKARKDTIDKLKDEILGGKGTVLEYLEWRTIHDFLANFKPGQTVRLLIINGPNPYTRVLARGERILYLYGQPPNEFYRLEDRYIEDIRKAIRKMKPNDAVDIFLSEKFIKIFNYTQQQWNDIGNCSVIKDKVVCPGDKEISHDLAQVILFEEQYWNDVMHGRPTNRKA